MEELYGVFRRNFPFAVRAEKTARQILSFTDNIVLREEGGVSVVNGNAVLMLCVEKDRRGQGIGSRLLERSECLVREAGYDRIVIGAGKDYLVPGVPMRSKPVSEPLLPDEPEPGLTDDAYRFFVNRGYRNSWDCCCFDMRADFSLLPENGPAAGSVTNGILCRIAGEHDIPGILACTESAEPGFSKYYRDPALYGNANNPVLVAEEAGEIRGAIMAGGDTEEKGTGSIGCTVVHEAHHGRGIASCLVLAGARFLKDAGYRRGFLGYTYSGLDRLYGKAGYRICTYYFMAEKLLTD